MNSALLNGDPPVSVELPDEDTTGLPIKWAYEPKARDIIMDASFNDSNNDGYDDNNILAFDVDADPSEFTATIIVDDLTNLTLTFEVSYTDGAFIIVYIPESEV